MYNNLNIKGTIIFKRSFIQISIKKLKNELNNKKL